MGFEGGGRDGWGPGRCSTALVLRMRACSWVVVRSDECMVFVLDTLPPSLHPDSPPPPPCRRHMFFCASLAIGLVKSGKVQSINMDRDTYMRAIVPIGACYALSLWVGNAAYLYLSVSFIQMLKALMPVAVFSIGCVFKTETFSWPIFSNMILVTIGVAIASFGEINFNVVGVMFQMGAIVAESIRLVLVQLLLQARGLKLNPITTLYYVAPCCFVFLLIPFFFLEAVSVVVMVGRMSVGCLRLGARSAHTPAHSSPTPLSQFTERDPGGPQRLHRPPALPAQRPGRLWPKHGRLSAHRQDQRADHEHRRRGQGLAPHRSLLLDLRVR